MRRAAALVFAALLAACGSAPRRDLDFDRLHASLQALATDPELGKLALAERALAEAAVRRLDASSINAKEHAQLSYLAERRVDIAYIAAQTEQEKARLAQLQREHAELLLAASRRETEAVRAELDRQRRDALLQQEEAERGGATPPQAGTAAVAAAAANSTPPAVPAATPPVVSLPDVDMTQAAAAAPAAASNATAGRAEPPAVDARRAGSAAQDGSALPATPSAAQAGTPPATPPATQDGAAQPPAPSASTSAASAPPPAAVPAPSATPAAQASSAPGTADAATAAADLPLAQRLAALTPDADSGGARITLEDLIFEPGTATFATGAEIGLARVAGWLAAAPAQAIRIEGHTDATGSPEANLSLSLRRAEAVRDALVARGVAAARIVVSGEGAAEPVASNDDAQGRARNRRVVVQLLDGG